MIPPSHRKVLPGLMACALFMETLDVTIISTAIPEIARDLGSDPISLKLALTAYLLSLAVFIPMSGWMADRLGARRVFCTAIGVFTLGSALCGLAGSLFWLVLARLIQGLGGAMMLPVARLVLMRAYPKEELVRATNYATIPSLIGPTLGPVVGGAIATYASWRWVFLVNLPFGLLGLLLAWRFVPDYRDPNVRPLDRVGFALFGIALASGSFGFESIGEAFISPMAQLGLLATSLTALALYIVHAQGRTAAFLNLALLQVRTFRITVLGSLLSRLGIGGVPFLLPLLLQLGLGMRPLRAGALVVPVSLAMILMKFCVKPILRRHGFRSTLCTNTFFLGICIALFATVGPKTSDPVIVVLAFAYGMLASLQFSCMNVLTYVDIGRADMGDATGIASTVQQFSMSFGVGVSALCLNAFIQSGGLAMDGAGAYQASFACLGLITSASAVVFSRLLENDGAAASGAQRCTLREKAHV
jgi:EmrB/QacA subfamily drug resistance transporter